MTAAAATNEYYSKTSLGQVRCRLCDSLHRDDANFLVHVDGKRHATNLKLIQLRQNQLREEQQVREAIAKQQAHDAHEAQLAQLTNGVVGPSAPAGAAGGAAARRAVAAAAAATVGLPSYSMQVDELGGTRMHSRVTITVSFPLAGGSSGAGAEGAPSRPMHRWLSTYEQSMEARDEGKQYLVIACEPYQSLAIAFPSNVAVATADNSDARDIQRYHCRWEPVGKTFLLMFTVSMR